MDLPTSPANPSALTEIPAAWIDKLFARFGGLYGKHWLDLWVGVPMADVKEAWSEALKYAGADQIRQALRYCQTHNKFPPTAPEFAALCRDFRPAASTLQALPSPRSNAPVPANIVDYLAKHRA